MVSPLLLSQLSLLYRRDSNGAIKFRNLLAKIESRFGTGPLSLLINTSLLIHILFRRPSFVFIYSNNNLSAFLLKLLRRTFGFRMLLFHNDSPFCMPKHTCMSRYWSIANVSDLILVYRKSDIPRYPSGFQSKLIPFEPFSSDTPYPSTEASFLYPIGFIGHYEDDGRLDCILHLARQYPGNVYLHGGGWSEHVSILKNAGVMTTNSYQTLSHADYKSILCSTRISLCFLSSANSDTLTRRVFEIPLSRSLLVSEFSEDIVCLYGDSVPYFNKSDPCSLVAAIKTLIGDPSLQDSYQSRQLSCYLSSHFTASYRSIQLANLLNGLESSS